MKLGEMRQYDKEVDIREQKEHEMRQEEARGKIMSSQSDKTK